MADTVVLRPEEAVSAPVNSMTVQNNEQPSLLSLQNNLMEASKLVDDIVLKKYFHRLSDLEIIPLGGELKKISDIRIFKINEMVYQNDEYSTYKFASVFNAVQNLNCGVFIIADSDGKKTDFYMGVEVILTLSQCFMKDMSVQEDESEIRRKLYKYWFDSVKEGERCERNEWV